MGHRAGVALLLAAVVGGCASQRHWSSEVEPPGLSLPADVRFSVRMMVRSHDDRVHARTVETRLQQAFGASGTEWELEVILLPVLPGGAWGEEAVCQLEVTIRHLAGKQEWRFNVNGYSGSTWVHDRIPSAVEQAILGLEARMASVRRGK